MALPRTDLEIISRLRERDHDAFGALVEQFAPRLKRWVSRMVDDPAEAEDIVQDALLSAWDSAPRLRPDTILAPWLKTISDNACRKRARSRSRKPALPSGLMVDGQVPAEPADVAQRVDVANALQELPDREAAVLRLLYAEDRPLAEAAGALNVSCAAARSLAARARQRFRQRFESWFRVTAGVAIRVRRFVLPEGETGVARAMAAASTTATVAVVLAIAGGPAPETSRAREAGLTAQKVAGDGGSASSTVPLAWRAWSHVRGAAPTPRPAVAGRPEGSQVGEGSRGNLGPLPGSAPDVASVIPKTPVTARVPQTSALSVPSLPPTPGAPSLSMPALPQARFPAGRSNA